LCLESCHENICKEGCVYSLFLNHRTRWPLSGQLMPKVGKFFFNGKFIDYLSLTYATNKKQNIKSSITNTTLKRREKTLTTFKINIGLLLIRSSHRNRRGKVSSPSFLSWPPSKVDPPPSGAPWATFLTAK